MGYLLVYFSTFQACLRSFLRLVVWVPIACDFIEGSNPSVHAESLVGDTMSFLQNHWNYDLLLIVFTVAFYVCNFVLLTEVFSK